MTTDTKQDKCLEDIAISIQREIDGLTREKNQAYAERDMAVAVIARMAELLDWPAGRREYVPASKKPEGEEAWQHVVFIEIPTGQISFHFRENEFSWFKHLPFYPEAWDGHTREEKYRRMLAPWPAAKPEGSE